MHFGGNWLIFVQLPAATSVLTHMNSRVLQAQTELQAENLAIAQALKRSDAGLLDELIVRYQHRLLRYLLYLTGNREMAEDVFQETWMRVLTRGGQFNGRARFETWLFTIARNLVIDQRRKRSMLSLDEMCDVGGEDRPIEFASHESSPFEHCCSQQDREHLSSALLMLEPLYREVVVLRFQEEMSLEEIARVTNAPLSTVKSRLYRGLAALKPKVNSLRGEHCGEDI